MFVLWSDLVIFVLSATPLTNSHLTNYIKSKEKISKNFLKISQNFPLLQPGGVTVGAQLLSVV